MLAQTLGHLRRFLAVLVFPKECAVQHTSFGPTEHRSRFRCGTCDAAPANDCARDCLGAWGGGEVEDACGVCGGDASSCADCAGVAHGNATADMCGTCDADAANDCGLDCEGEWGGGRHNDQCGICGGDPCLGLCGACGSVCAGLAVVEGSRVGEMDAAATAASCRVINHMSMTIPTAGDADTASYGTADKQATIAASIAAQMDLPAADVSVMAVAPEVGAVKLTLMLLLPEPAGRRRLDAAGRRMQVGRPRY